MYILYVKGQAVKTGGPNERWVEDSDSKSLSITQPELPKCKVVKTINSEDGEPHAGVTFKLYRGVKKGWYWDWTKVAEQATDADGIIEFGERDPGKYKLVEVVPAGYTSSLENNEKVFDLDEGEEKEIKVINYIPTITVVKTIDSEDGEPHEDVTFELYKWVYSWWPYQWKWEFITEQATDADGKIDFGVHFIGCRYKVKEIVPEGYTSSLENNEYEFVLGFAGEEIKVVNCEEETPIPETADIIVNKIMADDSSPEGIEFTLYRQVDGLWEPVGEPKETDAEGMVVFEELEAGTYMVEEEELEGYYPTYEGSDTVKLNGEDVTIYVINNPIPDEPTGSIKVVKTFDELDGDPHVGAKFKLYRQRSAGVALAMADDDDEWPKEGITVDGGICLFEGLDCENYYYILEEDTDGYKAKYYLNLESEGSDECPPIHLDCGEELTKVYVVNTETGGDEPGDDDNGEDETTGGGGGSRRRRPRTVEEEPVEVPEEPEVFTPPMVEEPVVVEEPLAAAPVLPDLPHTGGNPAAFVMVGAALAGLGLYVRKRR